MSRAVGPNRRGESLRRQDGRTADGKPSALQAHAKPPKTARIRCVVSAREPDAFVGVIV